MGDLTPIRPAAGFQLAGEIIRPFVDSLGERVGIEPRHTPTFIAEGNRVLDRCTREWLTPGRARERVATITELHAKADAPWDGIYEVRLLDLVRAIRAAERFEPTPPAAAGRVAA